MTAVEDVCGAEELLQKDEAFQFGALGEAPLVEGAALSAAFRSMHHSLRSP